MDRKLDNLLKLHYNLRKKISFKSIAASLCQVFFQVVKALRKNYGLTQIQSAKISGIKRPNTSRLKAGTHVPGIPLIECLAESLQVQTSDLIVGRNIDRKSQPLRHEGTMI